jgi:hypothetical protein
MNNSCKLRVKTKAKQGNATFLTMLAFLREFNMALNRIGEINEFIIFGGFIRRLVYSLYAVIDQNAMYGDANLKDGTYHDGGGDIDIYGNLSSFKQAIGMKPKEKTTVFNIFTITENTNLNNQTKYENSTVVTYYVKYDDPIHQTSTVFDIDIVKTQMKKTPCFNVNCLQYPLEHFGDLDTLFVNNNQKCRRMSSQFLSNINLSVDFNCKMYNYHCDYDAIQNIFKCIRKKEAIICLNLFKFYDKSSAHKEMEKYVTRAGKLNKWNFLNFDVSGARHACFPEKNITLVSARKLGFDFKIGSDYIIKCNIIPVFFQYLPTSIKNIILSYNSCNFCDIKSQKRKQCLPNWADYSSDDEY